MAFRFQNYEVLETIGTSPCGKCRKIRRRNDAKVLVWKELEYGKMADHEKFELSSDLAYLRKQKHPYLVRYQDIIIDYTNTTIFLVMNYYPGGDLRTLIRSHQTEKRFMEEDFLWKILLQLVLAILEVRTYWKYGDCRLYRNLRAENVLLDSNNNVKLRHSGLDDFLRDSSSRPENYCLESVCYAMPEGRYDAEKSDTWFLGCLMYEVCALYPPFAAKTIQAQEAKIREGRFAPLPFTFSGELYYLIKSMLRVDVRFRPSVEDLLRTPMLSRLHSKKKSPKGTLENVETRRVKDPLIYIRERLLADKERLIRSLARDELLLNGMTREPST